MLPSARQVYILAIHKLGIGSCLGLRPVAGSKSTHKGVTQRFLFGIIVFAAVGFFLSSQVHLHGHTSGSAPAHTDSHRSMFGSRHQAHAKQLMKPSTLSEQQAAGIERGAEAGMSNSKHDEVDQVGLVSKQAVKLAEVSQPSGNSMQLGKHQKSPNENWHVFYYSWYGNPENDGEWRHWNHELIQHWNSEQAKIWPKGQHEPPEDIGASFYPKFGAYSSSSIEVIHSHFEEIARQARIGTIVVSWYPAGSADSNGVPELADGMLPMLLDEAAKFGLKVSIHIEPYKDRTARSVMEDARYIQRTYGQHPALSRRALDTKLSDGSTEARSVPFIYVYDSYHISPADWAKELWKPVGYLGRAKVRQTEAFLVGLAVEKADMAKLHESGFHAMYTYFAATGFTYGSSPHNWDEMCQFCLKNDMVFIPSVGPGYDDTRVRPWNAVNSRPRRNGEYYKTYLNAALKCNQVMKASNGPGTVLSITSYNEWHEGTQIESAVVKDGYMDYGSMPPEGYLALTETYISKYEEQLE